jgi:hypothetical protein
MSQFVTHKDLARRLKVSETTIKSYRRKFAECIPVASKGKPIRFMPEAVEVCLHIRDYFDMGMSVEEVRARLAQEFSWISVVGGKKNEQADKNAPLPKEFLLSVSNLAKSMVTLTQQQSSIMERMGALEKTIGKGINANEMQGSATPSGDLKAVLEDLQIYLQNALGPLQQLERLAELEGFSQNLQSTTEIMREAVAFVGSLANHPEVQGILSKDASDESGAQPSKVVQFPSPAARQTADQPAPVASAPQDPPRAFLLKPMVLRTVEGVYMGAGGRSRGRFTLNDLKALLAYGRVTAERFTIHWEQLGGADWAVTLTQPEAAEPGTWRLHLREAMSQTGVGIVELVQFFNGTQQVHPSEFCAFVAGLVCTEQ